MTAMVTSIFISATKNSVAKKSSETSKAKDLCMRPNAQVFRFASR